jgi:N-acetylglucosamine-6-phosphate deacetylase
VKLGVAAAVSDGTIVPGDVEIADGRIAALGLPSPAGRGIAAPGLVDLQVNGFAGVDFLTADADGYRRAGSAILETGVTSFLPTFVSAPEPDLRAAIEALPEDAGGAHILGAHLEGPFLSLARLGVHREAYRRDPELPLLERLLAAGPVQVVTLAPELPGANVLVEHLVERGIAVSCGHSNATAGEANAAFDIGASSVTHLFNAMRPFHHRDPGLAGAALASDDVLVQIVLDFVHIARDAAALAWRAASGRLVLVTDAIAAAGLGDGEYRVGDVAVEVRDGVPRNADGALAGSTLTMIEAVRNLHSLGASLADSVAAASTLPARLLRLHEVGRLAVGLPADVVVLDDSLEVERVLVRGETQVA